MKNNQYLPFILLLFTTLILNAQGGCKGLEQWKQVILKEYPNINFKSNRYNKKQTENILFNLYSDKYFLLVSKKPLDELTNKQAVLLRNKLHQCGFKRKQWTSDFAEWFYLKGGKRFSSAGKSNVVTNNVKKARGLRLEYEQTISRIKSPNINTKELESISRSIDSKFGLLFPSEVNALKELVNSSKSDIVNKDVSLLMDEINQLPITYGSLDLLKRFKAGNELFFSNASLENRNKVESARATKIEVILKQLVQIEKKQLKNLVSLEKIDEYVPKYKRKFSQFINNKDVNEYLDILKELKTKIIVKNEQKILEIISSVTTDSFLKEINEGYIVNVTEENPSIQRIKKSIQFKKEELESKKTAIKNKIAEQNNLRQKLKSEVNDLRTRLNSKYKAYLPSLTDLREILDTWITVVNNFDGQYNVDDGNRFKRKIEYFGYKREYRENLVDIETFKNEIGYKITAGSREKTWDTNFDFIYISLDIEKAPSDILELYKKEFRSDYRLSSNEFFDGSEIKEGEYYVHSGAYLYKFMIRENQSMHINVVDNTNAFFPVMAEKSGVNEIVIEPWTTVTNIFLKEGSKIKLTASDYIKLGVFSVDCYANGIDGFTWNNLEGAKQFPHGSLIGHVGKDSSWEYVGKKKILTAKKPGLLRLRINDAIPQDNRGAFKVRYEYVFD